MLTAQDLCFSYPGAARAAVWQLSASWHPGQLCALVGPNGSGKTTLLRILSGELPAGQGEVRWDGRPLQTFNAEALARRRALLSQSPRLDFAFTVREVVLLGRTPYSDRTERLEDPERVTAALREVDLAGWEQQPYPELSRGEKQRVQLARVLAQLPSGTPGISALLLDEPTNHLDLAHQHQTLAVARRRADEGRMVITVLHDLNLALQYADRVMVLADGRAIADGAPPDVLTPELLASAFGVCATTVQLPGGRSVLAIAGGRPPPAP